MKFKMNNREWEIKEVNQDKMRELENDDDKRNTYYGLTTYENQTIWIWGDLHPNQKRQTLIHELFHCYVGCYYSFQETVYTEELVCNLVGNSHDIIHEIVEEYFKEVEFEDFSKKYSCKSNTEICRDMQQEVLEEAVKKKSNRYTTVAQMAKGDIEFDQEDFEKYVAENKKSA